MRAPRSIVTLLAALAACALVSAGGAAAEPDRLAVTGFQSAADPVARIDASARALDTVGVDGVSLAPSGATFDAPDGAALAQLRRAHRDHLRAEFLISNFSDPIDDFSEPVAWRLLGSSAHRRAIAARVARVVRGQHWDGVNVDLESLTARDRNGLVDLLRLIRRALPRSRTLTVDLMASTSRGDYPATGYDVRAISNVADVVVLMTYDQHGPWENTPGPVGSLVWTRRCLAAALSLGASRSKLELGVAGYGYAWRPHANIQVSDAQARRLAGSRARWDRTAEEWTATLPDGSVLWWSDARSYRARYAFAAAQHLHGLAVWSLGLSDPLPGR